ncbi:glutamate receptor 2.8, partial [Nicotiana attenuata]
KELQKNKEYVGYQQGSFVKELLIKNNFDEDRLKQYNSSAKCIDLLSKGSAKGGIAAAFDEIPYVKPLQAINCSKYATVGPMYKSDGFGFSELWGLKECDNGILPALSKNRRKHGSMDDKKETRD